MPIPCYLALTAAEFANVCPLPEKIAWMACHFSCYGTGLSNLPETLPEGSMILVNDRMPPDRHDPGKILEQLQALEEAFRPDAFLLDFQREGIALNQQIARALTEGLSCAIGVTPQYARDLSCPVFLEPPPLHMPPGKHISPWEGREIWLEAALQTEEYRITAQGCEIRTQENGPLPEPFFLEESVFCRYHTAVSQDAALFTLQRTAEDWQTLLQETTGITRAVGLYQQFGSNAIRST